MVKKAAVILIVFSIIITSMCFSIYADDEIEASIKMYYNFTLNGVNKNGYNLIPNQPFPLIINAQNGDTFTFEINRLYFLDNNSSNSRYFINLKCGFFETHGTDGTGYQAFHSNNFANITNSTNFVFRNYPNLYYDPNFLQTAAHATFWNGPGFWFYGSGDRRPSFDLDKSVTFTYNPGTQAGQHVLWIVFYDVQVVADYNWLWYQLNTYLNAYQGYFINLIQNTYDMLNHLTGQSIWTVSRDQYDEDGNFIGGQEVQVTWYDAIYQLLSNLYAPVKVQSEQEQKAKEAGAIDALDDAYNAADDAGSFWDLIPFIGFAGFGDYDDDAASNLGTGSITDWFSDTNKGWLENVPIQRYVDDDFVDFYQQNIYDINGLLGDQTSRSIRGSP